MKKIFCLLVPICFVFAAQSQVFNFKSTSYGNVLDTVTNSANKTLISGKIGSYTKLVTVQLTATEISGTTDAEATLYGSLDGANFYLLSDSTITLADAATQTFSWHIYNVGDPYLMISVTGTGTMSDIISAKYITR